MISIEKMPAYRGKKVVQRGYSPDSAASVGRITRLPLGYRSVRLSWATAFSLSIASCPP